MKPSGERYMPDQREVQMALEHWHRYLFAESRCVGSVVLDVACGAGYGTALIARSAERAIGFDKDSCTVDYARLHYESPACEFMVGDARDMPFLDDTFDVVVSFETIEHLPEEDHEKFLEQVKRVLDPNGIFILSTPNRQVYNLSKKQENKFHKKEYDLEELVASLEVKFSHIEVLGLRALMLSHLGSQFEKPDHIYGIEIGDHGFSPVEVLELPPEYYVVICSEKPLNAIESTICVDYKDALNEQMNDHLCQLVNAKGNVDRLVEELAQAKDTIDALSSEIEIARRSHSVRDEQEAELQAKIKQLKETLSLTYDESVNASLEEKDRVLAETVKKMEDLDRSKQELISRYSADRQGLCSDRDRVSVELMETRDQLFSTVLMLRSLEDRLKEANILVKEKQVVMQEQSEDLVAISRRLERLKSNRWVRLLGNLRLIEDSSDD